MKGARFFALAFAAATLSAPAARSATFAELSDRAQDSQSSPSVTYPASPYAAIPYGAPSYIFGYGYAAGPYAPTPTYSGLKAPPGGPEGALPENFAAPARAPRAPNPAFGGGWGSQEQGRGPYSAGPSLTGPYAIGPNGAASQYGFGGAGWGSQDQGRGPDSAGPSPTGPYAVGPNGAASQYEFGGAGYGAPYAPNPAFGGGAPQISGGPEGVLPADLGGPAAATTPPMPLIRPGPNHFQDFGPDPYRPNVPLRLETFGQVNSTTDPYNPWGLSTPFMFMPWSTPLAGWTNAQTWNWWRERSGALPGNW